MKIVVTGSLGNVGKPLAQMLVQKGHEVTVVSHNPDKEKDIEALGARAAIGSLQDTNFLISTFAGADAVFAMVPPNYAATDNRAYCSTIGNSYAQAIRQCGIKRVVQLSSWGAHLDTGTGFILGAHDVEVIFRELTDVDITYLRAGSFYTNLYRFMDMIKEAGIIGANYGDNDTFVWVHPRDIAAAAVEELETTATGQKVRYVASDESTAGEIANALGSAIGRPDLPWITFTDEQAKANMERNGVPPHIVAPTIEMGAAMHSGKLIEDYNLHKPVMGKVKLADFAREFAAAYLQK